MQLFLLDTHTISPETVSKMAATLPPFRAERAARCRRPEGYVQTVAGFCLVRYAIRQLDPHANTEIWEFTESGKPRLAAEKPFFSLSHTTHCIAVAVSAKEEVGVDIEEIKPRSRGFAARYYAKAEQRTVLTAADPESEIIRLWSAKEAEVKRTGTGLAGVDLSDIPLNGVKSSRIEVAGIPHWLSVSPAAFFPPVTWVRAEQLLTDCGFEE